MAQAFDNQSFVSSKKQIFQPDVSLSPKSSRKNVFKDTATFRQVSLRPTRSPLPHEEININKSIDNHETSTTTFHSSLLSNDLSYRPARQSVTEQCLKHSTEKYNTDTKPPSHIRMPRLLSTADNNNVRLTHVLLPSTSDKMKKNITYLNATQLYITQPSSQNNPPPPPPRCPINPPAIPPRNSTMNQQKNSVTIPNFNSSTPSKTIYRAPAVSPTTKRNDLNLNNSLENPIQSLSVDNDHHARENTANQSTIGEYFGECSKCGETVTSLDDPCDILGQIYHSSCAVCVLCGRSVKNRHFYLQDQLYCEEDFLYTGFQETLEHCAICDHLITDTILQALGKSYHLTCFKCSKCSICLDGIPFMKDEDNTLFCVHDYHATYGPHCNKCSNPIFPEDGSNETVRIISMGKNFHVQCYHCEDCSTQLGNEPDRRCYPLDDKLFCEECCYRRLMCYNRF